MADNPKRCFVISPIGAAGSPERKHADMTLHAIIRPALDECGITFDVKRADDSAEIGMVTDHIITEILESDLIVADLSFLNPNVFYELGIAHAEGKPVIHLAHCETKLPFDNIGYRAVLFDPSDWDSHVDAKTQIAEAACNALTQGSAISNPVTHARGWKKLKVSADSEQAIVAQLVQDVAIFKKVLSKVLDHFDDPKTIEDERKREAARQNLIKALGNSLIGDLPKLSEYMPEQPVKKT
jgi:nucleoside 2-deoxyribosyltransferase